MYEDYYLGYPELEEALAAAGYSAPAAAPASVAGIGSPTATAAPAAATSVLESALAASAAGQGLTQGQYDALADRRAAANTRPQGTFLAAPTDNRGKATGFDIAGQGSNLFEYQGGPVRVTDRNGKVLFSGDGPEGALEAVKFAQNLSATKGKNASWDIQQGERTINPDGSVGPTRWVSGPTDAKEGMGVVGDIAAFALPIAAAVLTAGMSLPYQIAAAASAGMVGGVMSGKDPLKSALIAGASAGAMNVSGANAAIGKAVNNISTAVTNAFVSEAAKETAKEVVKNAVGELGEQIVVTAISKTIQGVGNSLGNTLLSEVVKNAGVGDITGYKTPAEKFVEQTQPEVANPVVDGIDQVTGEIVASGERIGAVADTAANVITGIGSSAATDAITGFETPTEKFVQETPAETTQTDTQTPAEDTIVVSGERITPAADAITGAISGVANLSPEVLAGIAEFEKNPIISTGAKTTTTPEGAAAGAVAPEVLAGIAEFEKNPIVSTGAKTTTTPEGAAAGAVAPEVLAGIAEFEKNPIVSTGTKTTTTPEGAGIGAAIPGVEDFLMSTELQKKIDEEKNRKEEEKKTTLEKVKDAAQIVSTAATIVPLVTGAVGGGGGGGGTLPADTTRLTFTPTTLRSTLTGGIGGAGARYPYTPTTYGQVGGDQETEFLFFTKDPITGQESIQSGTPVTTTNTTPAAAPGKKEGGEIEDDMVKHLVEYHKNGGHQGPGQVKGIGSGQEDKIPAWLSDGEYVWSAQDVADLGDGSTDEGVRRLDKMRQMVRRQAGRRDVKKIAKPQKGIDKMLKAVGGMA
jgi:hypothetical protein